MHAGWPWEYGRGLGLHHFWPLSCTLPWVGGWGVAREPCFLLQSPYTSSHTSHRVGIPGCQCGWGALHRWWWSPTVACCPWSCPTLFPWVVPAKTCDWGDMRLKNWATNSSPSLPSKSNCGFFFFPSTASAFDSFIQKC